MQWFAMRQPGEVRRRGPCPQRRSAQGRIGYRGLHRCRSRRSHSRCATSGRIHGLNVEHILGQILHLGNIRFAQPAEVNCFHNLARKLGAIRIRIASHKNAMSLEGNEKCSGSRGQHFHRVGVVEVVRVEGICWLRTLSSITTEIP